MKKGENIFTEFLRFARAKKELWLLPLLLILIILALFIAFGQGRLNIPFIYSQF
ncbi:MAG: DUF5989 family protein [Candidatus Omnitrophica bacterium]|jgi:hypothetical protein|nr:DUF5989 family protein [Candidatus Omnitrophota bacterium]